MSISFEEFEKIELRVGKIIEVSDFPEARKPAYKLRIDFGELGIKNSSAQITTLYSKEELLGRLVVCATSLAPRQVGPFMSEVLTTGFYREDGAVVLSMPEREVPLGSRLA